MAAEHNLTDMDKLAHLLEHWQGHNTDHVTDYRDWAEKAGAAGKAETADLLRQAAEATDRVTSLFAQALKAMVG